MLSQTKNYATVTNGTWRAAVAGVVLVVVEVAAIVEAVPPVVEPVVVKPAAAIIQKPAGHVVTRLDKAIN